MSNIGTKFNLANRFIFDPNTNSLVDKESDNEITYLGSNESRILRLLCDNPGEVITRNDLHDFVWRMQGFEVDDSSLTQAISTLRKALNDSTKSPQFVKTVPKRGYQLISSVEKTVPLMGGESKADDQIPTEEPAAIAEVEAAPTPAIDETEIKDSQETVEEPNQPKPVSSEKTDSKLVSRLLIALALFLPICAVLFTNPTTSEFRQIAVYDNTPVKTPANHPSLSMWNQSIEQCVKRYNESHKGSLAPKEVIATGGQDNSLVLNYIHSLDHSGENITLKIYVDQADISNVCQ
ncbi:winged helix-turn-helix domain-containing protein [Vibrio japonicus]|uniref:Transcriptional regulator n=1 Tax=Vibrio japonicus TaxID=1824638 RepID=A0ABY5LK26_9VIBR|nr:transcriptional regulator [Vibrio japonicus]UUM31245.1 transcriptional regulator [Vibrio japonicus]